MQGNCLLLAVATIGVHSFLSVNCCYSVTKLCLCEMLFLSRDSLRLRGLQHARLLCPSLSPRLCSNSYPLSRWCYLTISSSATCFSFGLQSFPASGSSPMSQLSSSGGQSIGVSASTISPCNEHPGSISFRLDWLDLLAVQGNLKCLLQNHSSKASIVQCSAFFMVQLSHP